MPNRTPAVCPYYLRERRLEILCEGLVDGVDSGVQFSGKGERRRWFSAYCGGFGYLQCPYARMIGGKYEQDTGKAMESRRKAGG